MIQICYTYNILRTFSLIVWSIFVSIFSIFSCIDIFDFFVEKIGYISDIYQWYISCQPCYSSIMFWILLLETDLSRKFTEIVGTSSWSADICSTTDSTTDNWDTVGSWSQAGSSCASSSTTSCSTAPSLGGGSGSWSQAGSLWASSSTASCSTAPSLGGSGSWSWTGLLTGFTRPYPGIDPGWVYYFTPTATA